MNTDHNTLVSLLNTGYAKIRGDKVKAKTQNFDNLDVVTYNDTLNQALSYINQTTGNVDDLYKAITQAVEDTLSATAEEEKKRF